MPLVNQPLGQRWRFSISTRGEGTCKTTLLRPQAPERRSVHVNVVPDHKLTLSGEKARISAAGGFVDFGRVNGNLALSRAIGDFEFKKGADLAPEQQIVTAFPDVVTHDISTDDEFLVIACDGTLFSHMTDARY